MLDSSTSLSLSINDNTSQPGSVEIHSQASVSFDADTRPSLVVDEAHAAFLSVLQDAIPSTPSYEVIVVSNRILDGANRGG